MAWEEKEGTVERSGQFGVIFEEEIQGAGGVHGRCAWKVHGQDFGG